MKQVSRVLIAVSCVVSLLCGCATPQPLSYLAVEKPVGPIVSQNSTPSHRAYRRGGFYFWNLNFRPAANMRSYLEQAHKDADVGVLRDADIKLCVPVCFDILFFGYNVGIDFVSSR